MKERRSWRWLGLALALLAALVVVAGCGTTDSSDDKSSTSADSSSSDSAGNGKKVKMAFVYNGPPNALGWDTAIDVGRKAAEAKFGDQLETTYKVAFQGPQIERALNSFVQDGNDVIWGTSFGQQEFSLPLAKKETGIKFHQVSTAAIDPNVSGFSFGLEDGYYIMGMAGAALAKNGQLGMVGSFPVPDVMTAVNAMQLGAQQVNPDAHVRVVWTNDWVSPSKAQDAAQALINSGAQVLGYMTTGPAPSEIADKAGIPWIGFEASHKKFAPDTFLNGVLLNWAPMIEKSVEDVQNGTWKPETYYGTYQNDAIQFEGWGPPYDKVPDDVKSKIDDAMAGLKDGSLKVFTGPIYDQSGKLRVKDGEEEAVGDILGTDYLVKGVIGKAATQ